MPMKCSVCVHSEREQIDAALVSGTPLRKIAQQSGTSVTALFRHKSHVSQAIIKAGEHREEHLGDSLLDQMRKIQGKAWELLGRCEQEGDTRASIVALKEVRECLQSLGDMLSAVSASDVEAQPALVCKVSVIGSPVTCPHCGERIESVAYESLPDRWLDLLPGKPKGRLYIVRPHEDAGLT